MSLTGAFKYADTGSIVGLFCGAGKCDQQNLQSLETSGTLLQRMGTNIAPVSVDSKSLNVNRSEVGAHAKAQGNLSAISSMKQEISTVRGVIQDSIRSAQNEIATATKEAGYNAEQIFPRQMGNSGELTGSVIGEAVAPGVSAIGAAMDIIAAAKSPKDIKAAKAEILEIVQNNNPTIAQQEVSQDSGAAPAPKNMFDKLGIDDLDTIMLIDPNDPSILFEGGELNNIEDALDKAADNLHGLAENRASISIKTEEIAGVSNVDKACGSGMDARYADATDVALTCAAIKEISILTFPEVSKEFKLAAQMKSLPEVTQKLEKVPEPEHAIPPPQQTAAAETIGGMGSAMGV